MLVSLKKNRCRRAMFGRNSCHRINVESACPAGFPPHIGGNMFSRAFVSMIGALALASSLSACGTSPTRQQVGTAGGAVAGGVLGNVLTNGSTLGTVGGAAVGGVVGNQVTKP
jgi:osmotically inducible lipoprotein OsmB